MEVELINPIESKGSPESEKASEEWVVALKSDQAVLQEVLESEDSPFMADLPRLNVRSDIYEQTSIDKRPEEEIRKDGFRSELQIRTSKLAHKMIAELKTIEDDLLLQSPEERKSILEAVEKTVTEIQNAQTPIGGGQASAEEKKKYYQDLMQQNVDLEIINTTLLATIAEAKLSKDDSASATFKDRIKLMFANQHPWENIDWIDALMKEKVGQAIFRIAKIIGIEKMNLNKYLAFGLILRVGLQEYPPLFEQAFLKQNRETKEN